jgi:hypothetical protein
MKAKAVAVVWICILLVTFVPANTLFAANSVPDVQKTKADCTNFVHHNYNSVWMEEIWTGTVYANKRTQDVIAYKWIPLCGQYLVSIWRGGQWKTHFFPAGGLGYIFTEIAKVNARKVTWKIFSARGFILILLPDPCTYNRHLICPGVS